MEMPPTRANLRGRSARQREQHHLITRGQTEALPQTDQKQPRATGRGLTRVCLWSSKRRQAKKRGSSRQDTERYNEREDSRGGHAH